MKHEAELRFNLKHCCKATCDKFLSCGYTSLKNYILNDFFFVIVDPRFFVHLIVEGTFYTKMNFNFELHHE